MIYAHLFAGPGSDGVARVEDHGPLTETWIRNHLSPHANITLVPVFDIEGQAPVDGYEIPHRHRQAVHLMAPADTFPYGNSLSRSLQLDHTIAFRRGVAGQTRLGNLGKLTILHHRIKTFTGWEAHEPFPGIRIWRDPFGALYLVDHTGTRRIGKDGDAA